MILLTEDCSEVRIQVVKKTLLDEIIKENDIKSIPPSAYRRLAKDIRKELVHGISKTGGHLASNLGTVELTMALHLYLDFPKDKLVWDVGHQAYTHKPVSYTHLDVYKRQALNAAGELCGGYARWHWLSDPAGAEQPTLSLIHI